VAHVRLAEDDHMVQTFPPYRSDRSFDVAVLPRRSRCRSSISDTHGSKTPP